MPGRDRRSQSRQAAAGTALFILQRLAFGALVLGSITFLSFLGLEMARGTDLGPAVVYAVDSSLHYLGQLLQGDLGYTQAGSISFLPVPVSDVLWGYVAKSLGLLAFSLLIATAVGVSLGLLAAARRHSGSSLGIIMLSIIGVSVPSFFAALLLQLLMIRWARVFGSPLLPIGGFGWDKHIILPALVLAARPIAQITRMTLVSVGDVLDQDYVRTARGKGLRSWVVWSRHVIRNAGIPILTTIGVSLRFMLISLPVVEFFFGWPGIGFTLLRSISRQDDNLTVALLLSLGVLVILVNLLLELAYRLVDPRLREANGVQREDRHSLKDQLSGLAAAMRDWLANNPVRRWRSGEHADQAEEESPFKQVAARHEISAQGQLGLYQGERRRAWWRATAGNLPFVLGGILVAGMLAIVFWGPRLTPHNPYATQGLTIVDGQFLVPPFEPGDQYPWGTDVLGRDVLSLILAGAQQTLTLAAVVVAARLAIGLVLGAVAGWLSGSWIDRAVMGLAEIIAAFPALLLAMIIILAIGIRQGMRPFVIALCFVGWGEIMQFVRGEDMAIRPKPTIEGAVAVGLRSSRIVIRHVVPILLAALISLVALEMGAVLMLLGELGFLGVFIGGGAFAELDVGSLLYHYSDVPEWGSLLSNVRPYARSYPWVAFFPALAFFIAIVGFNLFGEGLRQMVETVGIGLGKLINRYTLAAALLVVLVTIWLRGNTGALAYYRQQADAFDGQRALATVEYLAQSSQQGRALGTNGVGDAADWIAGQFQELRLQPAGQEMTYFQNRTRAFTVWNSTPELVLDDGGVAPVYHQDYAEYPGYYNGAGDGQARIRAVIAGELDSPGYSLRYPALEEKVTGDEILMVFSDREAEYARRVPRAGLLVVAGDDDAVRHRITPPGRSARFRDPLQDTMRGELNPTLWISPNLADRILAATGTSVEALRLETTRLNRNEATDLLIDVSASMAITGTVVEKWPVRNVLGLMPGAVGRAGAGDTAFDTNTPGSAAQDPLGEAKLDDQLVVVLARYDSPPVGPEGAWEHANDNGSGVAVLLEALRTVQESGYAPYRSFVFVVYSGEGLDGGEIIRPQDVSKFLQARAGFGSFDVEAIVDLRALGTGEGDRLVISAGGNQRLAALLERAARRAGVGTMRAAQALDMSIVFEDQLRQEGGGQEAPYVLLTWEGWEATARMAEDTAAAVSSEKLEKAGRTLALALMIMGREDQY
jgi:peptide/nickel transport system permease protein